MNFFLSDIYPSKSLSDPSLVIFNIGELYPYGFIEYTGIYQTECVPQSICEYQCLENECVISKKDLLESCTSDSECESGSCPFGYCTMECENGASCPTLNYCFKEDVTDEFGICAFCEDENDCSGDAPCINGRCESQETTGNEVTFTGSTYLGNGKNLLEYTLSWSSPIVSTILPFLKINSSVDGKNINVTLPFYQNFYISVPAYNITSLPKMKIEPKGNSFQNILLNYTNALKFQFNGAYENENFTFRFTCTNTSSDFGFSNGTANYSCVCGKGYFCEEGKPCACIIKDPEEEFYGPQDVINLSADVNPNPVGSIYNWYLDGQFLVEGIFVDKEEGLSFVYPSIYPIKLQVIKSSEEDNQTEDLIVLDGEPVCYITTDNEAIWLVSSDSSVSREVIGVDQQKCNPSGYPGTCCSVGQYCDLNDGICKDSPENRISCSNYTDEANCTIDPYNYAVLNPQLPEGSQGCSKPFYNVSENKWYNTECFCTWEGGVCLSNYNLSKDGNYQGTCSYDKVIVAGDCSEGDLEYIYNMNASWDGLGDRPSTCINKDNIKAYCTGGIIKLPFFTWTSFVGAIIIILIVYSLFFRKKKVKAE